MDVPRVKKPNRAPLLWVGGVALLALTTLGISQLKPAAPVLESGSLWFGHVKRGDMVREVRGTGSLVPEDQRLVSALTSGRVERVLVRPGARVEPQTLLLELSNPDVQLEALDAERQVKLAEADLASLRASLDGQRLAAVASVASVKREEREAERAVAVAERLAAEGLGSSMDVDRARDQAEDARARYASEQERLSVLTESLRAQLVLRQSEVERLRAISRFQQQRVGSMQVRAGMAGVVQELSLEPGQWVNPGQLMARVAGQDHLKAVIRIPENQARDLALGLAAVVDTRDAKIRGHVSRIDPGVSGSTVAVDVALDDSLPRGARPDLSVEATVVIDRLKDVLYVERPADGSAEGTVRMFRVDAGGHNAVRVPVRLGRGSATTVEVLEGLKAGDQVILTEMSRYENSERVRIR